MPKSGDGIVPIDFATLASGRPVVVCRTYVQRGEVRTPVTLFLSQPGDPAPEGRELDALQNDASGLGLGAVLEASGAGEAMVVARSADVASQELLAMAAAVCAASWGWDESAIIRVSVNDAVHLVEPRYAGAGEQWHAGIVAPTDGSADSAEGRSIVR